MADSWRRDEYSNRNATMMERYKNPIPINLSASNLLVCEMIQFTLAAIFTSQHILVLHLISRAAAAEGIKGPGDNQILS